jgi:hypothetical protein
MWSSVSVVVHAWSRLLLYPTLLIVVLVLRTAPALGWPRVRPWSLGLAWLLLVLVPTPGAQSLGDTDILVLLVIAILASELQTPRDWQAAGGALVAAVLLAGACGTLMPARLSACTAMNYAQLVAYGGALLALGWAWYSWPRQTSAQRIVLFGIALLWSHLASAPWQWWWLAWGGSGVSVALTWFVLRQQTRNQAGLE